jgi:small subunit ribosomal protein S1
MAKKQEAEKELKAKEAELGTVTAPTAEKETIESEADSISIENPRCRFRLGCR